MGRSNDNYRGWSHSKPFLQNQWDIIRPICEDVNARRSKFLEGQNRFWQENSSVLYAYVCARFHFYCFSTEFGHRAGQLIVLGKVYQLNFRKEENQKSWTFTFRSKFDSLYKSFRFIIRDNLARFIAKTPWRKFGLR